MFLYCTVQRIQKLKGQFASNGLGYFRKHACEKHQIAFVRTFLSVWHTLSVSGLVTVIMIPTLKQTTSHRCYSNTHQPFQAIICLCILNAFQHWKTRNLMKKICLYFRKLETNTSLSVFEYVQWKWCYRWDWWSCLCFMSILSIGQSNMTLLY